MSAGADKVGVLLVMGRNHCMSATRGLAPFGCKCGRWNLEAMPTKGKSGSVTLRARLLRVSELYSRHIRDERNALEPRHV